jgi:hypothetical protein
MIEFYNTIFFFKVKNITFPDSFTLKEREKERLYFKINNNSLVFMESTRMCAPERQGFVMLQCYFSGAENIAYNLWHVFTKYFLNK